MDSPEPPATNLLGIAVLFEGGTAVLALTLGWLFAQPPTRYVHWSAGALAWGCLGSLPLLVVMLLVTHFPLGPLARLNQVVRDVIVPLFKSCSRLDFFTISLLAGVGEELLFRGVIQARLADWLSPAAGLVLASLLFGLAHTITAAYAVMATIFGLYLGGLWLWSGNLLVAITAHAIYDFLALVYLTRRHELTRRHDDHSHPPA
jgi:membrane protease YdiL (CAAX protease family)